MNAKSSRSPDRIGHACATFAQWGRAACRGVDRGLVFELSINLGSDQDHHGGDPDPGHETDCGTK